MSEGWERTPNFHILQKKLLQISILCCQIVIMSITYVWHTGKKIRKHTLLKKISHWFLPTVQNNVAKVLNKWAKKFGPIILKTAQFHNLSSLFWRMYSCVVKIHIIYCIWYCTYLLFCQCVMLQKASIVSTCTTKLWNALGLYPNTKYLSPIFTHYNNHNRQCIGSLNTLCFIYTCTYILAIQYTFCTCTHACTYTYIHVHVYIHMNVL